MEKTKVTIYDVARRLGVSTTTVNRVLNNKPNVSEKTRKAVLEVVEEMNYRPSKTASSLSRSLVRIDLILAHTIFDFDMEIRQGAEDAYKELFDFNLRGEVVDVPLTGDTEEFYRALDERAKVCDGLALIPHSNNEAVSAYLDRNYADSNVRFCAGIGKLDSNIPLFTVVCNGRVAGGMAAQMLDLMLQGRGKVAMFTGCTDAYIHKATWEGFSEYVSASGLCQCGVYEHGDNPERAMEETERLLKEHPDVKGIYIGTANSIPICRKLEELGYAGRIRVVASDIFADLSQLMDRGIVDATIFQNPYMVGKMMVQNMYEVIAEGKELETKTFLLDPQIVVNTNKKLYM